jgi:hypothetical protein
MGPLKALGDLLSRFRRNQQGQIAVVFALAVIPIIGGVGAAVDYSRANNSRTALQQATDSAVLAAAKDGTSNWKSVAENIFKGNLATKGAVVGIPTFTVSNAIYSGTATGTVKTAFLGLVNINEMPISVHSSATRRHLNNGPCLIALDTGAPVSDVAITFNGAPNVNLDGCTIRFNTSMACHGHGTEATAAIAVGSATGCSNQQSNASPLPDIYAPLASNISTVCGSSAPGGSWSPGSPPPPPIMKPISKGNYNEYHVCGDLTLSGNGYLFGASPGSDAVIVIENGSLTLASTASISTVRTTIVLTGNNTSPSAINFPNGGGNASTLSLSPSTDASNPWQGVSLYQDPALTNSIDENWGAGATFTADGVVYFPKANVTISGNSASNVSSCTVFVANTVKTNGSVNLSFSRKSDGCVQLGVKQYDDVVAYLLK